MERTLSARSFAVALLASTIVAAQPAPEPPRAHDPAACLRWLEKREGPEPFAWAEDLDGKVRVKLPTGWRVASERTKERGIKLFGIPAEADPKAPNQAFLLFILPVPEEDRVHMASVAVAAAEHFARLQMPARAPLPPTRQTVFDGDPAWEIPIEPTPDASTGMLRARGGDRAVAIAIHHASPLLPTHRALFDYVDASLEVRLFAPRLAVWIPASWKGEAIEFGGRTAIAVGPRSIAAGPNRSAPRLVIATQEGTRLAGFDARSVARNVALNFQLEHAKSAQPRELMGGDTIALGRSQAAREILRGAATPETPASEVWFVVAKATDEPHADLWIVYGSPDSLAREELRLRAMLASAALAPYAPEPPIPPAGSGS